MYSSRDKIPGRTALPAALATAGADATSPASATAYAPSDRHKCQCLRIVPDFDPRHPLQRPSKRVSACLLAVHVSHRLLTPPSSVNLPRTRRSASAGYLDHIMSIPASTEYRDILKGLVTYRASLYLSTASLTFVIYDHLLTLADEVAYVWKAPPSLPKYLFLLNRYLIPVVVALSLHAFANITQEPIAPEFCKAWSALSLVSGAISIACSTFIILLRLWVLWERRIWLVLWTLGCFVASQVATIILLGIITKELVDVMTWSPMLRVCNASQKVTLGWIWLPSVIFDAIIFITTWWNALSRPRSRNRELVRRLYKDGAAFFFVLFGLRVINAVVGILASYTLTLLGVFFVWCGSAATMSHLVIHLRKMAVGVSDDDTGSVGEVNELSYVVRGTSQSSRTETESGY